MRTKSIYWRRKERFAKERWVGARKKGTMRETREE